MSFRVAVSRLKAGSRPIGSQTEHYWRWPVMPHLFLGWLRDQRSHRPVDGHGVRDGVVRGHGWPPGLAVRTFLHFGPLTIEFGWRRQRIEDWRWRRRLRAGEHR